MKLYTMAGTCALAPNIAVAWTDAPIEIVNLKYGAQKKADYLSVNPRGQVPALVFDDGDVLTEAVAILDFIGTKFGKDKGFSRDLPLGRKEVEALSFLSSEVHAAFKGHFSPDTFADSNEMKQIVRRKTYARLDGYFEQLNDWIGRSEGPYMLERKSFADTYLYIVTRWMDGTPLSIDDYPRLQTHQQTMEQDDGVLTALSRQAMKPVTLAS